jgi:transcriptional regulator with XRE-family HTH domain
MGVIKQHGRQSRWTTVIDGDLLRRMRRQRGLSQERLADLAGVSLTTVARLERPSMQPCRTWTLYRLANALEQHPGPPPAEPSLRVTGLAPGAGEQETRQDE